MSACPVPADGDAAGAPLIGILSAFDASAVTAYRVGDDVYRERACLVAHLVRQYPGGCCWYLDPADPGYPIVYVQTEAGQLSWHIATCDTHLFPSLPFAERNPWDGHDTAEKYRRLASLPRRW